MTDTAPARKKTRRRAALLLAGVPVLAWGAALLYIDTYGHREGAQAADAIVVLGARVLPNGKASLSLRERTQHAAKLYQRGLAPYLICSGGMGDNPPSEAQVAADLAVKLGVPRDKVLLEDQSTSTSENARFTAQLCHQRRWTEVIVVSQPFHLWRARRDFQQHGLRAYTSPVRDANVDARPLQRLLWTAREVLLVGRDLLGD
jgi:uncharacterized SAM-binding protein YcdF (DUF218 family)